MLPALLFYFLAAAKPEQRAVDFLAREVPRWSGENHCFSCHNNGDGARALFAARKAGYTVPDASLADTIDWLRHPERWDEIHGSPAASDKKLARIQFSAALAQACRTGQIRDREPLRRAANSLLKLQEPDGAWLVDTGGLPGAPATYGAVLATYLARQTLETAASPQYAEAIARANRWLAAIEPANLLDTAALLLALPRSETIRRRCLPVLVNAQTSDGGWGPQPHAPAEAFDTAVAMLALRAASESAPLARARGFLLKTQDQSGAWPETTRPGGGSSYAEEISTAAWVTLALLDSGGN